MRDFVATKFCIAVLLSFCITAVFADGPNELFTVEQVPSSSNISATTSAGVDGQSANPVKLFEVDRFVLPTAKSKIPSRFVLSSYLKHGEPADRLESITIGGEQPSLYLYMRLTGTDQNRPYKLRLRVLDAKRELVFDREASFASPTNAMVFRSVISPRRVIDEPGTWEFQGMLDGEQLFVEKRAVYFSHP